MTFAKWGKYLNKKLENLYRDCGNLLILTCLDRTKELSELTVFVGRTSEC